MTLQQGLAFAVMGGAVGLFIWGKLRYDLVALLALVAGVLLGVIPADRMFSGFSNDLIWIIASVLLLSAAIQRSGLVDRALQPILGRIGGSWLQTPAFAGAVMLLSMMVKNIGALAILMPVAIQTAKKNEAPVSRLLMPMSFASLLGGLVTLVGTSPNVIVSSVRESMLGKPYALFDFAPVGLGVLVRRASSFWPSRSSLFVSTAPRRPAWTPPSRARATLLNFPCPMTRNGSASPSPNSTASAPRTSISSRSSVNPSPGSRRRIVCSRPATTSWSKANSPNWRNSPRPPSWS